MGPVAKRRKTTKVEEVSFDAADREEFLTGFRKRKQQRIKHAQEIAIKRAKEEKRQDRKKVPIENLRFRPSPTCTNFSALSSFAKSERLSSSERWKSTDDS